MLTWIRDYLTRRCARVKANNTISNLVHLHEGVPQGGVLSPTLFLVHDNDLPQLFSLYIHLSLHADNLGIRTAAETIGTEQTRMKDAISKVEKCSKDWGVTINDSKTAAILYSLSTKPEQFRTKVNGHDIPASSTIKYLGVTFDQRVTWSKNILDISSRATMRMRILKKLAGTQWGANLKTARLHRQCETGTRIWLLDIWNSNIDNTPKARQNSKHWSQNHKWRYEVYTNQFFFFFFFVLQTNQ